LELAAYDKETSAFGLESFLECLRHAGLVKVERQDANGLCVDIIPPNTIIDTRRWARQTAEYMQHLHYNAVAAPVMPEGDSNAVDEMKTS
jgi:hypothetical protein